MNSSQLAPGMGPRWALPILVFGPCLACLALGCKATPAAPAGFADPDGMRHNPKVPFHRVWKDRAFDFGARQHMHVAAVNTDYLMDRTWWQGLGRGGKAHSDVIDLASQFRQGVMKAFAEDKEHRFTVVDADKLDQHRSSALILEFAIVELVPHKALAQALTYPAGPLGLLARQGMNAAGATSIAIEGRLRDAKTMAVVARFADREKKKAGLINIKNFTWYAHVRAIMDDWATQFVQVANKPPEATVPDTPAWRWLPW